MFCLQFVWREDELHYIKKLARELPPGTKPIHAGKNLGELIFSRIHAGPVFALARIQENIFEVSFSAYEPNS